MRTLVVAFEYPWPVGSGSRHRLLTTVRALCRCGPTELFSIAPDTRADFDEPDPSLGLGSVGRVSVRPAGARFGGVLHPLLPATIPIGDRRRVSHALRRFASAPYDLVWCFNVRAWILAGAPQRTPAVIDLDDLEHLKIRGRLSIDAGDRAPDQAAKSRRRYAAVDRWERWPGQAWSQLEALRWVQLYRRASTRVARTVVCSPLDADRATSSGVKRVTVVPNGYELPDQPVGRIGVGSPPNVLFQGTLRYPPNADAARWLVGQIAPALRAQIPDARVRLVGLATPDQMGLHRPPATTMVGTVPDMVTELSRADLVIVPLRYGSGTRVKIIEAFAHRIPVVSTTIGAEGLGVEDGRHLLVADTAQQLASACARLITDPALRRRLVDAAYVRYLEAFQCDVVEGRVTEVAQAAVARGGRAGP
ncbi:MAG TPA: glycosyltransferase family 4 protein [Acidimicrobiales bacterium]|nr:glycosyltransferase family 4 protein [Acidimicrobiales bacterium]